MKSTYLTKNLGYALIAINQKLNIIGVEIAILKYFNKDLVNGPVEMSILIDLLKMLN